jgi:hypothetical protein
MRVTLGAMVTPEGPSVQSPVRDLTGVREDGSISGYGDGSASSMELR